MKNAKRLCRTRPVGAELLGFNVAPQDGGRMISSRRVVGEGFQKGESKSNGRSVENHIKTRRKGITKCGQKKSSSIGGAVGLYSFRKTREE